MKLGLFGLCAVALFALAACNGSSIDIGAGTDSGNTEQPAASGSPATKPVLNITTADMLRTALEAAGITSVHPVNTTDGSIAAWASVPGFQKCPVRFVRTPDGSYDAQQLHKPDGAIVQLEGLPKQPSPLDFASFGAQNLTTLFDCRGDTPPAEGDWPTT
jgi:hypothetical protein